MPGSVAIGGNLSASGGISATGALSTSSSLGTANILYFNSTPAGAYNSYIYSNNAVDTNWGLLYRPGQNGVTGSHGFLNASGVELARITSAGVVQATGGFSGNLTGNATTATSLSHVTIAGTRRVADTSVSIPLGIGGSATSADIYLPYSGVLRTKLSLTGLTGNVTSGRIYKNGVAFGTARSFNATGTTVYTEDLTFAAGDLVTVVISVNGGTAFSASSILQLGEGSPITYTTGFSI
jgi:hypothetical protein